MCPAALTLDLPARTASKRAAGEGTSGRAAGWAALRCCCCACCCCSVCRSCWLEGGAASGCSLGRPAASSSGRGTASASGLIAARGCRIVEPCSCCSALRASTSASLCCAALPGRAFSSTVPGAPAALLVVSAGATGCCAVAGGSVVPESDTGAAGTDTPPSGLASIAAADAAPAAPISVPSPSACVTLLLSSCTKLFASVLSRHAIVLAGTASWLAAATPEINSRGAGADT